MAIGRSVGALVGELSHWLKEGWPGRVLHREVLVFLEEPRWPPCGVWCSAVLKIFCPKILLLNGDHRSLINLSHLPCTSLLFIYHFCFFNLKKYQKLIFYFNL